MPNLKPYSEGIIKFREGKLSKALQFNAKLYVSPFNSMVPKELVKMRIEGEFFDIKFNPFTGAANCSFSFGEGIRLEVRMFRDAIKLLSLLTSTESRLYIELVFKNLPKLEFKIGRKEHDFDFSKVLDALESAVNILSSFDISDYVDISFDEISSYETEICQLDSIANSSHGVIKVEFSVEEEGFKPASEVACISLVTAPIGSHIFGVFLVIIGKAKSIEKDRYQLITQNAIVEKKIVSERDNIIRNDDLIEILKAIETKYDKDYTTVSISK